jgi:hypothetical protein
MGSAPAEAIARTEPGYAVIERPENGTEGPPRIISRHPTVLMAYRALVTLAVVHKSSNVMDVISTSEEISWVGHELAYRQALLEMRGKL